MLLIRHRARLLGVAQLIEIESAGLGNSAANRDPMPQVAQRAVIRAARILNLGDKSVSATGELLTLRQEAKCHRSSRITVDDEALQTGTVICLLTRKAASKL